MLERVKSGEKVKVMWMLSPEIVTRIRVRSAELGKTQSKFITDLVREEKECASRLRRVSNGA